ncbi:MAG: M55 family metallopeptidase [Candidatus Omnitrophica bacterium]|nr:M55 family metallopeptidase [Candidatus Omnitrophota bacterium]MCM8803447.1 M55 family metallopeptidase [Candidatus Omnitrophota bacterium]
MKIYIATDLEGATGVFKFKQTRERGPEFYEAMKLLMGDIVAVVEGLKESGVKEIYVLDGHNGGNNFIPDLMISGVKYITGYPRPGILYGLDETFDGIILLGYHAMNGTPDGVLHHTQSSLVELKYFYNGIERGEIFQSAVIAGYYNVPVILVTGDEATCREAKELLGNNLPTVAVKKGISREAAILLSPKETKILLKDGAKKAIKMLPKLKPYKIKLPVKLKIRRIGPEGTSPENPYFSEKELIVESPLDIITGSKK